MFTIYVVVTVVTALVNAASAAADFARYQQIAVNMAKVGVPTSWMTMLGVFKAVCRQESDSSQDAGVDRTVRPNWAELGGGETRLATDFHEGHHRWFAPLTETPGDGALPSRRHEAFRHVNQRRSEYAV